MQVICSWCRGEGRVGFVGEKAPFGDRRETHSICIEHLQVVRARWTACQRSTGLPGASIDMPKERPSHSPGGAIGRGYVLLRHSKDSRIVSSPVWFTQLVVERVILDRFGTFEVGFVLGVVDSQGRTFVPVCPIQFVLFRHRQTHMEWGAPTSRLSLAQASPASLRISSSVSYSSSSSGSTVGIMNEQDVPFGLKPFEIGQTLLQCVPVVSEVIRKIECPCELIEESRGSSAFLPLDGTHGKSRRRFQQRCG